MGARSTRDIRFIGDDRAFAELKQPWSALDAQPSVRPFQQYGWIAAWRNTLGVGVDLHLAAHWSDGTLQAVLPLCIRRMKGLRVLEWMAGDVSDYCDGIAVAGPAGDEALRELWEAVWARGGFEIARLRHVRADARLAPILDASNPWFETREHAGGIPISWVSGEEWLKTRSKKMRDNITYKARRMTKAGFEARIVPLDEPSGPLLDILAAQKRPWLAARGLTGPICEEAGLQFLKQAAAHAASRGELRLSVVRDATHVAAIDLGFMRSGTVYSYLASFDAEYAKYSFGRLLTDQFVMWACEHGISRFDLMLGAYDYKSEYGCDLESVNTLTLARSIVGRAAVALYRSRRKNTQ